MSAVVLGTRLVGGTADGEAGTVALVVTLLHDAGTVLIVSLASWSDCFSESFFLIAWSRSRTDRLIKLLVPICLCLFGVDECLSELRIAFNCFLKSINLHVGFAKLFT